MGTGNSHSAGQRAYREAATPPAIDLLSAAFRKASASMPRLEAIIVALEETIGSGALAPGTRVPTVRQLSKALRVSPSTALAAYGVLNDRGRIAGEVGRGTFVLDARSSGATVAAPEAAPWRRRMAATSAERLADRYRCELDGASGRPDTALIVSPAVLRSVARVAGEIGGEDLQYADAEPLGELRDAILPRLRRDGIPTEGTQLVVGASALQLMLLAVHLAARAASGRPKVVAVEEPGHLTVFDALEQAGCRLSPLAVDEEGVTPEALDRALADGAAAAILTPRAQNPTGAGWVRRRRVALTEVLEAHPRALVIEDDAFADLAAGSPGTLLDGRTCGDRVVHIRSFAKTLAPDLRIAVAVARPRLAAQLAELNALWDGWTSRLSQRILAGTLDDTETDAGLALARNAYRRRREIVTGILTERLGHLGARARGADGLNVWLQLPPGLSDAALVEQAAARGVLVASGEPFHIRPGHHGTVRVSVGALSEEDAETAANLVADAVLTSLRRASAAIVV